MIYFIGKLIIKFYYMINMYSVIPLKVLNFA